MKTKKDKIIVAVTGVTLTIVFLVALIIGDASSVKMDNPTESTGQLADKGEDSTSGTSEGETSSNNIDEGSDATSESSGEASSDGETTIEDETEPEEETTTAPPVKEPEFFLVNLSDFVYVREGASKESTILGKVYAGGGGEVIEAGAEWTKIKSGNVEGYVFTEYIWTGEDAKTNLPVVGKKIGTITTEDLRIRKSGSLSAKVVGYYDTGAEVEIVEIGEEWHEIEYDGDEAYISAQYVDIRYEYSLGVTLAEEEAAKKAEEERLAAIAAEEERKRQEQAALLEQAAANSLPLTIVKTPAYTDISDEDIYLMMCVVSKECGHDVYEGQLAVANIILNRYNGKGYGDTVRDVLYAKNQFSVVYYESFQKVVQEGPLESARQAVLEALSGVNNVPRYTNYRSLTGIEAEDYEIMKEYSIIGNQVFYNRK